MESVLSTVERSQSRIVPLLEPFRFAERVAIGFFLYLAALAFVRPVSALQHALLFGIPLVLWGVWRAESANTRAWTRVLREWTCLGVILLAYWLLEWFAAPPVLTLQQEWLRWDRALLDTFRFRGLIEAGGIVVPNVLETVYLFLYAIPAASLGAVYAFGTRAKRNQFLFVLMLGTLTAYAMLPLIPVISPRIAFPHEDLPRFSGLSRQINTWVLDNMDISTGVFPSGHVAVAFSSAFGLLSVLRERRWVWISGFLAGFAVYAATIYGRYHYAVDGLTSICIAAAAWRVSEACASND